jgi:hypothetical protein
MKFFYKEDGQPNGFKVNKNGQTKYIEVNEVTGNITIYNDSNAIEETMNIKGIKKKTIFEKIKNGDDIFSTGLQFDSTNHKYQLSNDDKTMGFYKIKGISTSNIPMKEIDTTEQKEELIKNLFSKYMRDSIQVQSSVDDIAYVDYYHLYWPRNIPSEITNFKEWITQKTKFKLSDQDIRDALTYITTGTDNDIKSRIDNIMNTYRKSTYTLSTEIKLLKEEYIKYYFREFNTKNESELAEMSDDDIDKYITAFTNALKQNVEYQKYYDNLVLQF